MLENSKPGQSHLEEENRRLRRAVEELSILNDLARTIGGATSSEEIIQTITRRSLKAVQAEQGVISLAEKEMTDPMKTLIRATSSSSDQEKFHLNQSLLGWMHLNKKPLTLNSPRTDSRFQGVTWDASIRNICCVPLMIKSEVKGVLAVYNKKGSEEFSEEDQRLLAIIAAQSAQIIDNARLYEQEREFLSMQEQIKLAAKIQMELLPKDAPNVPGYEIAGRSIPAQLVGGDYFDFIPIDEKRMALALGDVTGKGLPASLLMANTQATLRGQSLLASAANDCITRSNTLLFRSTSDEKFVTLFYGVLDFQQHQLTFCNAGHDSPFLLSSGGGVKRLSTGGIILSMMESFPYDEEIVPMHVGDVLVIYSDGIPEAMNTHQELFTEKRLQDVLLSHYSDPAEKMIDAILAETKTHAGGYPQSDDMTIVIAKRIG